MGIARGRNAGATRSVAAVVAMNVQVLQRRVANHQVLVHNVADVAIDGIPVDFDVGADVRVLEEDAAERNVLQARVGPDAPDRGTVPMGHACPERSPTEMAVLDEHVRGMH